MYIGYLATLTRRSDTLPIKIEIYNNNSYLRNLNFMTIDLAKYTVNRDPVYKLANDHKDDDIHKHISLFACTTHCPVIVVAFYVGEALGFNPEIVQIINSLIKFYDYKAIINQKEGSPFLHLDTTRDIVR